MRPVGQAPARTANCPIPTVVGEIFTYMSANKGEQVAKFTSHIRPTKYYQALSDLPVSDNILGRRFSVPFSGRWHETTGDICGEGETAAVCQKDARASTGCKLGTSSLCRKVVVLARHW